MVPSGSLYESLWDRPHALRVAVVGVRMPRVSLLQQKSVTRYLTISAVLRQHESSPRILHRFMIQLIRG